MCHVFADQARTKGMSRHPGVGPGVPLDRPDLRTREPAPVTRVARLGVALHTPTPSRSDKFDAGKNHPWVSFLPQVLEARCRLPFEY